jgi:MoxR-like ATPase
MPAATDSWSAVLRPSAPPTLAASGLSRDLLNALILRVLYGATELTGAELARRLGLSFTVIEPCLVYLKDQRQAEVLGGSMIGGPTLRYRLTEAGRSQAVASLDRTLYVGPAPVPLAQYRDYMARAKQAMSPRVSGEQVRAAFFDLVLGDRVLDQIGQAINAGHSMFLYGPPGNGKSLMAQTVRRLLHGTLAIPHAIEVKDQIIRFFDPSIHEPIDAQPEPIDDSTIRNDQRWVQCRRPMVTVGGELTLSSLGLAFNARSGVYTAPVQALANGGVLVIDDFGRQQSSPRDLLNWWMAPLESRVEYLSLASGEKFEMPFDPFIIFSTNIRPSDLVDEAFLRRIYYKIYVESPTADEFARIFARNCEHRGVRYQPALVEHLFATCYRPRNLELRACHPRDLINQALSLADYLGLERQLSTDLLSRACASYFLDEREAISGRRPL